MKPMMLKANALALLTIGLLWGQNGKLVSDLNGPPIRYRAVIGSFTEKSFQEMALSVLSGRDTTLGLVAAYGSTKDQIIAGPRGFDHCGYGHWRSVFDGAGGSRACPEVREAIKIGSTIVFRSVDPECRRTRTIIGRAGDPLHLVIDGAKIELLEISFSRPLGEGKRYMVRAEFYARSNGGVSEQLAKGITSYLEHLTGAVRIGVELRADSWFITDCGFPTVYPFEAQPRAPSPEKFSRTRFASCGIVDAAGKEISCFEGTSRP